LKGLNRKMLTNANRIEFFLIDYNISADPQAEKTCPTRFFNIFLQSVSFQIEFSMILCFLFDLYEFWNNSFSESFPKIFRELAEKQ
jgi:hypothetical protein